MPETLLSASSITLFGRVVEDINIVPDDSNKSHHPSEAPAEGEKPEIQRQLTHGSGLEDSSARLARIYGFSYEGAYFEMAGATLFLVHGPGVESSDIKVPGPNRRDEQFYSELKAWAYDRTNQTMRLDVDSGSFEQVLLSTVGDGGDVSGARVSGARVAGARVSGARVSGARVSGARVSGARVSGARISGADD